MFPLTRVKCFNVAVIHQSSDQIKQLLKCLLTADQFQPALSMYRERLLEALKVNSNSNEIIGFYNHFGY